jgi:hypothetical protein
MKTFAEVKQAREWARRQFGDPAAAVLHLFFRWHDGNGMEYTGEDLIASMWGGRFTLWVARQYPVSLPVVVGPEKIRNPQTMEMEAWGTSRLGPGVWALSPSLNQPGAVHAYIVLTDVPEPPPWGAPA